MKRSAVKDLLSSSTSTDGLIRPCAEDDFPEILAFLRESQNLYPDIERWWHRKVVPGLDTGQREALVVETAHGLGGLFIGKHGRRAKLCTLRLRETLRSRGLGRVLVTEGLGRILDDKSESVHVTVSEAADGTVLPFFQAIGFAQIGVEPEKYRSGVGEYICYSPATVVQRLIKESLSAGVDATLFGARPIALPAEKTLVMSLKPEFATAVLAGEKTVEFRRRFSSKYIGATIVFYVSGAVKEFLFTARIGWVECKQTTELWADYYREGAISKTTFDKYFDGTDRGYAIQLENVAPVPRKLNLYDARTLFPELRPPQSFQTIQPNSALLRVLGVTTTY